MTLVLSHRTSMKRAIFIEVLLYTVVLLIFLYLKGTIFLFIEMFLLLFIVKLGYI